MRTLKQGDKGPDVKQLQQQLNLFGFPCGTPDGAFGGNTRTAVVSFQRSRGLVADGVVGPSTQRALGLISDSDFLSAVSVIPQVTVDLVLRIFPGTPRTNIETHLPFVLSALEKNELADKDMVLMALATIRAETASFLPISEAVSKFNTTLPGTPPFFDKYDFNNEKWLLKRNKIYHSKKSDGTFDTKRYFIKAKMSDLKYHAK